MSVQQSTLISFGQRARLHNNAVGAELLLLMERKQTNLCVAADLTTKQELLDLAEAVGPHICLLKVSNKQLPFITHSSIYLYLYT
jgi:hypothetical protein